MARSDCTMELAQVGSGITGPLYAEGIVVQAADLTLDRNSHTEALWRMRRLLHGWGIVAGLQVVKGDKDSLSILPGYGVAPDGAEIYLPQEVRVEEVLAQMKAACNPAGDACALPSASATEKAAGEGRDTPVEAWLVLRSTWVDAAPRPGLPKGCAHPGNAMFPTRACNRVAVELHCTPPQGHIPTQADCAAVKAIVCDGQPLPFSLTEADGQMLVLARLSLDGQTLALDRSVRQRLLPVAVIQQFMTCFACTPVRPDPQPPTDTANDAPLDDVVTPPVSDVRESVKDKIRKLQERGIQVADIRDPDVLITDFGVLPEEVDIFLELTGPTIPGGGFTDPLPDEKVGDFMVLYDAPARMDPKIKTSVEETGVLKNVTDAGLSVSEIVNGDAQALSVQFGGDAGMMKGLQDNLSRMAGMGPAIKF